MLNTPPTLTGFTTPATFVEGGAAVRIAPAATVSDDHNLRGGRIAVSGLNADDRVTILSIGSGADPITTSGNEIHYFGSRIGTFTGGVGTPLVITLLDASATAVTYLLRQIAYSNVNEAPAATRSLILDITDRSGESIGSGVTPGYVAVAPEANPFAAVDLGDFAAPAAVDVNYDGLVDLVFARSNDGQLVTLFNNGNGGFTQGATPFNFSNGQAGGTALGTIDLTNEGRLSLIVGGPSGSFSVIENLGFGFGEQNSSVRFPGASGSAVSPAFLDVDRDGRLDLLTGGADGRISVFRDVNGQFLNQINVLSPFPDYAALGERHSAPTMFDVDGDHDLDALITTTAGLHYLRNDNGVFTELFGADNPFAGLSIGARSKLTFLDVNNDGAPDLVVGKADGTVDLFLSTARYGVAFTMNVLAVNDRPILDLNGAAAGLNVTASYVENAAPTVIAPATTLTDVDWTSQNPTSLTVSIAGQLAEDRLSLLARGPVTVSGSDVLHSGSRIGSWSGGTASTALTVSFDVGVSMTQIAAVAQAVGYDNISDAPDPAPRSVTFAVNDGDGGAGAIATAAASVSIFSIPDPIVIAAPNTPQSWYVGGPLTQTVGGGYTVSDADGNNDHSFNIFVVWTRTSANEAFSYDPYYADTRYTNNGNVWALGGSASTMEGVQAALASLRLTGTAFNGPTTIPITIILTAGGLIRAEFSSSVTLQGTRSGDPSVLLDGTTGSGVTRTYVGSTGATTIAPDAVVTDPTPTSYRYGTVQASVTGAAAGDTLAIAQGGGITLNGSSVAYNGQTIGRVTPPSTATSLQIDLVDGASQAAVQAVTRAITFANASATPVAGNRVVSIAVNDGAGGIGRNTATITVQQFDAVPVLANLPTSVAHTDFSARLIAPTATITDSDGNNGGSVTVAGLGTNDIVGIRHQGTGAGQIGVSGSMISYQGIAIASFTGGTGSTLTITLNGATSMAAMQALLQNLTFANPNPAAAASRTLLLNITGATGIDLGESAGAGSARGRAITVTVAERPNLDLNAADGFAVTTVSAAYTENGAPLAVAPNASVVGASLSATALTVTIAANASADDRLSILSVGGVAASGGTITYNSATIGSYTGGTGTTPLTISFGSGASAAATQAVARAIGYANASDTPSTAPRAVDFAVVFASGTVNATATVNVAAVDDPIRFDIDVTNGATTGSSATYVENAAPLHVAPNALVSDPELNQPIRRVEIELHDQQAGDILAITPLAGSRLTIAGNVLQYDGVTVGTTNWTVNGYYGYLRIDFTAPSNAEVVQAIVRALTFFADTDTLSAAPRFIFVPLFLSEFSFIGDSVTVTPVPVDDPVRFDLDTADGPGTTGSTIAYVENAAPVRIAPSALLTDLDGGPVTTRVTFAVTANGNGDDRLTVANEGMGAGQIGFSGLNLYFGGVRVGTFTGGGGASPLVVTFTNAIADETVTAVVRAVQYSSVSDNPGATRTITVTADRTAGSVATTATVNITAIDDPLFLDLHLPDGPGATHANAAYREGDAPVAVAPGAGVYDLDSPVPNLSLLTVSWRVNATADDRLSVIAAGGLTVSNSVLSYNGGAIGTVTGGVGANALVIAFDGGGIDAATATAVLRAIGFSNVSSTPSTESRGITLTGAFVGGGTLAANAAIAVTAVNSLPVAVNDATSLPENATTAINVLSNDFDSDGPAPTVVQLNRTFVAVNQPFPLASGAQIFLLADGTIGYDPNGAFNALAAGATATDSFAYTLAGGVEGIVTVTITGVDTPPVGTPDTATVAENATFTVTVLSNDTDVDGGPKSVATINGAAAAIDTAITLASGATATLRADGTISYDPNGKFDYLVATAVPGAVNTSATDSFTYALNGGSSTTVTVTITGVDGANDEQRGNGGNNTLTGTGAAEYFNLDQGGTDSVSAGGGDDLILFGGSYDPTDSIDGGAGTDQFGIRGTYTATLGNVIGTEYIAILSGTSTRYGGDGTARYDYNLTTTDATVAAGVQYVVQANELVAGEDLRFDGSAETDGRFLMYAGMGVDTLIGGAGNDAFYFGEGGRFTADDTVVGGLGTNDQLGLRGNYSVNLGANTISGIEVVALMSAKDVRFGPESVAYTYTLVLDDGNVASGARLTVNAGTLRSDESANVDGRAESNGSFFFIGGAGAESFSGGAGDDRLFGGLGTDSLRGGGGNDVFVYDDIAQSTPASRDAILDFTLGDRIDLSGIDANTTGAAPGDQAFAFIGAATFGNVAGELRVTANGGGWLVEGDTDGNGTADFAIQLTVPDAHPITATDFIL